MIVLAQQLAPSVPTFDPVYLLLTGGAMLVSWLVGAMLQRRFREYSQMPVRMTGAQVAQKMLQDSGIHDVRIISTPGQLTDHYNPLDKTVNLSEPVYHANSVAAAAVAAHECGHAIQHARAYAPLKMRSTLVPVVNFASHWVQYVTYTVAAIASIGQLLYYVFRLMEARR